MSFTNSEIERMHADPPASVHNEWCAERNHPGTCFNPWHGLTWCACGKRVTVGDTATHDLCCATGTVASVQLELVVV